MKYITYLIKCILNYKTCNYLYMIFFYKINKEILYIIIVTYLSY